MFPASVISAKMIASFAGKEMISETSSAVLSSATNVLAYGHEGVATLIEKLDIESRVTFIETVIKEIPKEIHEIYSIQLAINNVHEMVIRIQKELNDIEVILADHDEKWFASWRRPNCTYQLNMLVSHSNILKARMDRLLQLL